MSRIRAGEGLLRSDSKSPESDESPRVKLIFAGLMVAMLIAALDQTIVATALPTIVGDLKGLGRLSWVVTAYLLTSTASAPLYGKISDLYGRKKIFLGAIVVFLLGSALSGLAQSMNQLIAFRALQGLGAGGLIVLATTIIGDIVPPRDRGKYQGLFGAVFGVASVAGPLVGGWLVQGPGWRWVFYVNVPIGVVALVIISIALKESKGGLKYQVDYLGALLAVAAISTLLLVTVWGGSTYAWLSWQIGLLLAFGILLVLTFVYRESSAPDPILPLRLFKNKVFATANTASFIVGAAMFGAIIYLPTYLQIVRGVSPATSGLLLLPLMGGLLFSSIGSGLIISKIGRYKAFPIAGTAVMTLGMYLLSTLGIHSSYLRATLYMATVGIGIGMVMQVLVLAVQNAVGLKDMGVATSSATFFRSMGSAFGTAIFGSILTTRLAYNLKLVLPKNVTFEKLSGAITGSPEQLKLLPTAIHNAAVEAFVKSLHTVYLAAVPVAVLGFIVTLVLPEIKLRKSVDTLGDKESTTSTVEKSLGTL